MNLTLPKQWNNTPYARSRPVKSPLHSLLQHWRLFLVGCCVCSRRLAVVYAQDVLIFVSFSPFKLSPDSIIRCPPRTPTRPHLPSYPTSIAPTDCWLLSLFPVREKLIAPWNAMHSVTVILKTRRTKAELHIKWINKVYIPVCIQSGPFTLFIKLCGVRKW